MSEFHSYQCNQLYCLSLFSLKMQIMTFQCMIIILSKKKSVLFALRRFKQLLHRNNKHSQRNLLRNCSQLQNLSLFYSRKDDEPLYILLGRTVKFSVSRYGKRRKKKTTQNPKPKLNKKKYLATKGKIGKKLINIL